MIIIFATLAGVIAWAVWLVVAARRRAREKPLPDQD